MSGSGQSLRDEILDTHTWPELKKLYRDIHFTTEPYEALEHHASKKPYYLDAALPNLQNFWRYHVAPATHRKAGTHIASDVSEIVTRIAQRNYEVFANIFDALEELQTMESKGPQKPRYRSCLNILRNVGDACQLFDELIGVLGQKTDGFSSRKPPDGTLASALNVSIYFFRSDWSDYWSTSRKHVADYRHMLVHHGRPWLFFDGEEEHVGWPQVLKAEHLRIPGSSLRRPEYHTWTKQRDMFKKDKTKFQPLPEACKQTYKDGVAWLNGAYRRINERLDFVLADRKVYDAYRTLWGIKD